MLYHKARQKGFRSADRFVIIGDQGDNFNDVGGKWKKEEFLVFSSIIVYVSIPIIMYLNDAYYYNNDVCHPRGS